MASKAAAATETTKAPDFEGWLTKRSMWLKDWRKRYFVLRGNQLYFQKSKTDAPHGCIDLQDCLTVKSAEDKTEKKYSFEVATPRATYYMFADTEKVKDEWIGAIGRAIVRFSGSYTNEDGVEYDEEEDSDEEDSDAEE